MKKIVQFQLDNFGQYHFLFDDGSLAVGEQEQTPEGPKINITNLILN